MTDTRAQQCRGGSSAGAMLLVLIISRGLERSTDAALVVAEHEGALDEVRHGRELVLAEHVLDEGEDALRCRRGRRHREDDARRLCPSREARVVRAVEGEHRLRVPAHVCAVEHRARGGGRQVGRGAPA